MEAVLLTGALGAGKTSLLSAWAATGVVDTAVIVNEAGETGLDGLLVSSAAPSLGVRMLDNGCLCCLTGGDLGQAVTAIQAEHSERFGRPLRRVVVEASGLARPGPLLRQLRAAPGAPVASVRIVTAFDAVRGLSASTAAPEVIAQWTAADVVVLTKIDLVDIGVDALETMVAEVAPMASVVRGGGLEAALAVPSAPPRLSQTWGRSIPHGVQRLLVRPNGATISALRDWLEDIAGFLGEKLLRLKGLVHVAESDRPLVVQAVGSLISDLRPLSIMHEQGSFVVILARDLDGLDFTTIDPRGMFAVAAGPDRMPG